eukprot:s2097_g23.t1
MCVHAYSSWNPSTRPCSLPFHVNTVIDKHTPQGDVPTDHGTVVAPSAHTARAPRRQAQASRPSSADFSEDKSRVTPGFIPRTSKTFVFRASRRKVESVKEDVDTQLRNVNFQVLQCATRFARPDFQKRHPGTPQVFAPFGAPSPSSSGQVLRSVFYPWGQ